LKNKFTILGCGSSLGSPWITNNWGDCDKVNKKNLRTRCCAHFQYKDISVLIDTSPDLKSQFRQNKITNVDAVLYTHEHADQTSGIFELRPFFWKNKKKIEIYGSKKTIKELKKKYDFCFIPKQGYVPIANANIVKKSFNLKKKNNKLKISTFEVQHGLIKANGYILNKTAYLSDCSYVPHQSKIRLYGLDTLIVDCFRYIKFKAHFNFDDAIALANELKPKKTILTNLHVDLDYQKLKKKLPSNIIPAFDGMSFNF
jgi:phosphoribosyl 1,2-cyclic phosphate phosphodiesterase